VMDWINERSSRGLFRMRPRTPEVTGAAATGTRPVGPG
jgi:hypothetical protein